MQKQFLMQRNYKNIMIARFLRHPVLSISCSNSYNNKKLYMQVCVAKSFIPIILFLFQYIETLVAYENITIARIPISDNYFVALFNALSR